MAGRGGFYSPDASTTLVVCGLPEAGRLRVQRRDGLQTTLRDVYGAPELLYATPKTADPRLAAAILLDRVRLQVRRALHAHCCTR